MIMIKTRIDVADIAVFSSSIVKAHVNLPLHCKILYNIILHKYISKLRCNTSPSFKHKMHIFQKKNTAKADQK